MVFIECRANEWDGGNGLRTDAWIISALLVSAALGFIGGALLRLDPHEPGRVFDGTENQPSPPRDPSPLLGEAADWRRMTSQLSGRWATAMAYDEESDRVALFGGAIFVRGFTEQTDETWVYDFNANSWTFMNPSTHASPRAGHAMAYDMESDRIILFGGSVGMPSVYNDTWAYDFNTNTWTELAPEVAPSSRAGHTMAYDVESDRIILFGGYSGLSDLDDTWAYDFNTNTWMELSPNSRPPPRTWHATAYDSDSDRVVLFGGLDSKDDTWSYDFNANVWTNMNPLTHPSARTAHSMTYDAQSDRVIVFGGDTGVLNDETWVYDLNTNVWEDVSAVVRPAARSGQAMSYASGSDGIVLFGGLTFIGGFVDLPGDTWVYDTNTNEWTNASPQEPGPSGRWRHTMAYEAESDRVILFGGDTGLPNGETWSYDLDGNAWSNMNPVTSPSPRWGHVMSYDSQSDRIIVFGGETTPNVYEYSSETWAYDFNTNEWRNTTPPIGPSARRDPAMAYDSESDRVVLFGGYTPSENLEDMWTYDVDTNTWTEMVPEGRPSARWGHAMVYDAESDRVILFGGYSGLDRLNDTWAYDLNANEWTAMESSFVRPSARNNHAMAYDADLDRAVLFGGETDSQMGDSDTWLYDFDLDLWTNATPTTSPSARFWHAMAYDARSARVVLFGGSSGDDETWAYPAIVPLSVPGAPQLLQATASESKVQLAWRPPLYNGGSPVTQYKVYRGTMSGGLSLLTITDGALSLMDNAVTNGVTYYYHVTAVNAVGEGPPSIEVSATPTAGTPWLIPVLAAVATVGLTAAVVAVLIRRRRKERWGTKQNDDRSK